MSDAQLVQLPLGAGLDETAEDSLVSAPACRVAQNVVFPDETSAAKRLGLASIKSLGSVMPAAKRLVARGSEVLVTDGASLVSINTNLPGIVSRGQVSPCTLSRKLFASGNNTAAETALTLSAAYPIVPLSSIAEDPTTKLRVEVANDGVSLLAGVYDTVSGAYALPLTSVIAGPTANIGTGVPGGAYQPRVVIVSSVAWLFFHMPGVQGIQAMALQLANLGAGWSSPGVLAQMFPQDTDVFDVAVVQGTSTIAIAYTQPTFGGAEPNVALATWTVAGTAITFASAVAVQTTFGTAPNGPSAIAVQAAGAADGIVVAWAFYNTPSAGTTFYSLNWATFTTALAPVQANSAIVDSSYTPGTPLPQGALEFLAIAIARQTGTGTSSTAAWIVSYTRHYRLAIAPFSGGSQAGAGVLDTSQFGWFTITTGTGTAAATFPTVIGIVGMSKIAAYTVAGTVMWFQLVASLAGGNPQTGAQFRAVLNQQAVPLSTQTLVLVRLNPSGSNNLPTIAATAAVLAAGDVVPSSFDAAVSSDGTGLTFVGTEQDNAGSTNVSTLRANFTDPQLWQYVELGAWTWIAGGCPMQYDGSVLCEVGFVGVPQCPLVALPAAGATQLPQIAQVGGKAGGLQYRVVWAWQDNSGNVHRSAPSLASSNDSSAGYPSATIVCQVPQLTFRTNARCEIYRNTAATPTIFQLIASLVTAPTASTVTFSDQLNDVSIASQPEIYTQGGAEIGTAPPSLVALCIHADRVIGIDEDGQTPWFTTALTPAESPRFSVAFTMTPWPRSPVVAQWSLEQRLHAATAQQVMYALGEGPSDNGVGVDWTEPEVWQEGLGVANARCVSVFVDGALLVTNQGLQLEGRDASFAWASQCRRTLAANPVVVGIVPVSSDASVRIVLANLSGSSSVAVYWDHRRKKWATHTPPSGVAAQYIDAIAAGGTFYTLMPVAGSGVFVMQEQSAAPSWLDAIAGIGTGYVPSSLVTGWAGVAGDQGSTRVHRVMFRGLSNTPHGVSIVTARDRGTNDADVGTWSDADIAAMSIEQMRHTPQQQKCMQMSVTLTDSAPTTLGVGTGQGPSFQALLLRSRSRRGEWKRMTVAQQR